MNILFKSICISSFIFSLAVSRPPCVDGNRIPSYPYISGDGFRSMANHVYDETDRSLKAEEVQFADIVFVKTDYLDTFFNSIHPHIQNQYILISHNADHAAPATFESYLQDNKIIKWFGQNPTIMHHEKFVPIPIGLGNKYVGDHGQVVNFKNFSLGSQTKKNLLLGYNFDGSGNLERSFLVNKCAHLPYIKNISAHPHTLYLEKMSTAKFILSPIGNGLDCHRTWEALVVGTIPILKSSMLDELLEGLPVLIVKDWSEVNETFLEQSYDSITQLYNPHNLKKVTYAFWKKTLTRCQQKARAKECFDRLSTNG